MIKAHKIALDPTVEQSIYFAQACGTARFAYNWALNEWSKQYIDFKDGKTTIKPNALDLKKEWNQIRKTEFPWSLKVTKCAGAQSILNLGTAFSSFFKDAKKPKKDRKFLYPKFKKKSDGDSFTLWNDQFKLNVSNNINNKPISHIKIPNLGKSSWVRMREPLRLNGKILGAVISRSADRWFVSIQCEELDPNHAHINRGSIVGIDLGINSLMILSNPLADGTQIIENIRPLKGAMKRIKKLSRAISRQEKMRKKLGTKISNRMKKRRLALAKIHLKIKNRRSDHIHKATTLIAKYFETIILEDLNVSGMVKNHKLASAIHDASFGEIRRQLEYKSFNYGGKVLLADRFYPSSKTCSHCNHIFKELKRSDKSWTCDTCNTTHDRDLNAAKNLESLALFNLIEQDLSIKNLETKVKSNVMVSRKRFTKKKSLNVDALKTSEEITDTNLILNQEITENKNYVGQAMPKFVLSKDDTDEAHGDESSGKIERFYETDLREVRTKPVLKTLFDTN